MTTASLAAACGLLFFFVADHFISPPDCASYWAWAWAFARDFDFTFVDSYVRLSMPPYYTYVTATGHIANDWPMGSGVALAPVAWLGACAAHAWMVLWAAAALVMWWKAVRGRWRADGTHADGGPGVAVAATLFGTPLFFYVFFGPFFSHVVSFAVTTSFIVAWDVTRARRTASEWLLLGVLLGFAALIRPQNACLCVVLLAELPGMLRGPTSRAAVRLRSAAAFVPGALLAYAPQLIYNHMAHGSALALAKIDEMHWLRPAIGPMLWSDYHGVLTWTPVYAPAAIGLACLARRDRVLAAGLALALGVQVYLNAANMVWWCGGSFGNRRLSDSACIVAYGLAGLWARGDSRSWRTCIGALAAACCGWTVWLMLAERRMLVPLDRHVPFAGPAFADGMMRVWSEPLATLGALARPLASAGSMLKRAIVAFALAAAMAMLPATLGRLRRRHARHAAATIAALAALVLAGTLAAALRTGPLTDTERLQELDNSPKVLWDNFIELALYEEQRGNHAASEQAARRAIEMRPAHYSGWWYLGVALFSQQEWAGARAAFDKVLELNPGHRRAAAYHAQASGMLQGNTTPMPAVGTSP